MPNKNEIRLLRESSGYATRNSDEIDLLDLLFQLWHGKKVILSFIVAFLIIAGAYVTFAPEKWTSTALIQRPSMGQLANYDAAMNVLYSLSPQDSVSISELRKRVFQEFLTQLSSPDRQSRFLRGTDYFRSLNAKGDVEVQRQLEKLLLQFNLAPLSKDQPDTIKLTFTANTVQNAQKVLNDYIQQTADETGGKLYADLYNRLEVYRKELKASLDTQQQVAQVKKQNRIAILKEALKVAEESNVVGTKVQQAESLSDDTLFLLGSAALTAMIANENTRPLSYDQEYYKTQQSYLRVEGLELERGDISVFAYQQAPDAPGLRDSPKRTLVMVLALLIGGVLGAGAVLVQNMVRSYRKTA